MLEDALLTPLKGHEIWRKDMNRDKWDVRLEVILILHEIDVYYAQMLKCFHSTQFLSDTISFHFHWPRALTHKIQLIFYKIIWRYPPTRRLIAGSCLLISGLTFSFCFVFVNDFYKINWKIDSDWSHSRYEVPGKMFLSEFLPSSGTVSS